MFTSVIISSFSALCTLISMYMYKIQQLVRFIKTHVYRMLCVFDST